VEQTQILWYSTCKFNFLYKSLQDGSGTPILCAACQNGLQRIVERILDRGADPNAKERVINLSTYIQ